MNASMRTLKTSKGGEAMASMTMTPDRLREVSRCPGCGAPLIRVPVLACTRCEEKHPLRCFTYMHGDRHIAECIDLDLLAQGNTVEEAIGKLQEAMFGYLEVAFSGESTEGLVLRKSPLSHRLRYHLHRLRFAIPRHARRRSTHYVLPTSKLFEGQSFSHC
mgnify:FL=1